jgi:anti-anti-sigma regulatory factor
MLQCKFLLRSERLLCYNGFGVGPENAEGSFMPFIAEFQRARSLELREWVTPAGVVLGVAGDLDEAACRTIEQQLRRLIARWPGLLLTLDLDQVVKIEDQAAEALMLSVVAMRAGEARLGISAGAGGCKQLLARLGLTPLPPNSALLRWPGDAWGTGYMLSGVTA